MGIETAVGRSADQGCLFWIWTLYVRYGWIW